MRIVNTLCINKDKKVYVVILISLRKFLRTISKLPWMEDFECQLKTSRSGVCLEKNWMFVDRGEEAGEGTEIYTFLRTS